MTAHVASRVDVEHRAAWEEGAQSEEERGRLPSKAVCGGSEADSQHPLHPDD